MNSEQFLTKVHNYTKYKVVEMLVTKHKENKLQLDNLNAMEDLADDLILILSLIGEKFYLERKG